MTINNYVLTRVATFICLTATLTVLFLTESHHSQAQVIRTPESGAYSGTVYVDYNMNGIRNTNGASPNLAIDNGIGGVTVTLYDSGGVSRGSAVSAANGTYSIAATGTGPYRIEYTTLPTGYSPSVVGTNNASTVTFVPNGGSTDLNFGIISNADYCQNSPDLYVPINYFGDPTDNGTKRGLIRAVSTAGAPWNDPDAPGTASGDKEASVYAQPPATTILTTAQIGNVWASAYQRTTGRIFLAAQFKRHFGHLDNSVAAAGAIYVVNPNTSTVVNTIQVPGITLNSHLAGGTTWDRDGNTVGWEAAGKQSLGGIDISDDGQNLYVMNLENRTLYKLNANTGAELANASITGLTLPTPGGSAANCITNNKRPYAVKYYREALYIGVVCSGEGSSNLNDLRAYVFSVNPTTLAINPTPPVAVDLDYPRGIGKSGAPAAPAEWVTWRPTYDSVIGISNGPVILPQPILKTIAFENTNMILGLGDRLIDQVGSSVHSEPGSETLHSGNGAGDTLKLCGSPSAGWILESQARCGGGGTGPTRGISDGQGPGSPSVGEDGSYGEFFWQDGWQGSIVHDEVTTAGMESIPGVPQVVTTAYDAVNDPSRAGIEWDSSQGLRFLNTVTGATDRIYAINGVSGKGTNLGQVTFACNAAPLQIGNRVWRDSNRNGIQDANESPMAGVPIELYADTNGDGIPDTLVGTVVTDANGNYIFGGPSNTSLNPGVTILPNTAYEVRVPATSFNPGQRLENLTPTRPTNDPSPNGISRDSDGVQSQPRGNVIATVTTGKHGQNTHIIDFGFHTAVTASTVTVGGKVTRQNGSSVARIPIVLSGGHLSAPIRTVSNVFGYYKFSGIEVGHTYTVIVETKKYSFVEPVKTFSLTDAIFDLNFIMQN